MSISNNRVEANESRWIFPPKLYDVLKDTALLYLPAGGTLYGALAMVWGWDYSLQVAGTVLALETFLGAVLKISKTVYDNSDKSKDGDLSLTVSPGEVSISDVLVATPAAELANKDRIVLDVVTENPDAVVMDARTTDNSQN